MCILWLLLIGGAVYLIYKSNESKKVGSGEATPMETAKKRYARGEMTHEQFEQMKKDLQ